MAGEINTCKSSQCQTPQVSRPGSTIPGPAIVHHGLDDEDNTLKDGGYIGRGASRGCVSLLLAPAPDTFHTTLSDMASKVQLELK